MDDPYRQNSSMFYPWDVNPYCIFITRPRVIWREFPEITLTCDSVGAMYSSSRESVDAKIPGTILTLAGTVDSHNNSSRTTMALLLARRLTIVLLAVNAPLRATCFSTATPSPVVPQDSDSPVVQSLKEQIHDLRHEISVLQEHGDDATTTTTTTEFPWKQWYSDAEERNRALATARNQQVEDAMDQIDCLQNALELSDAEQVCTAAELERLREDYAALQTTLATVRQHHAENCAQWQASLDTAEAQLQQLQKNSLEELALIQEAASIELETTVAAYEAELGVVQGELEATKETLAQRERKLQNRGNRILVLEQEKRSLRMLCKNSVRLVIRRFNQRAERLVKDSLLSKPQRQSAPRKAVPEQRNVSTASPVSYEKQQIQEVQAIRELVAVSNKR